MAEQKITEAELKVLETGWDHWPLMSRLLAAYRAQAEEIERLKARGMTMNEVAVSLGAFTDKSSAYANCAAEVVCSILRSKGLLIEDAPKAADPVSPTTFIGGVRTDKMKRIPTVAEMQGILKEDDPLKVDAASRGTNLLCQLQDRHNALVDEVRNRLANLELTLEREPNFYNAYAESIEDHSERIAALEQQKTERVPVWPKLPQIKPTEDWNWLYVFAEFARIRAHLGAKESE